MTTPCSRALFVVALGHFITDLKAGQGFRPGLRVKRARGKVDVWEMTWASDGRATWQYGAEVKPGEPHIIWRRIRHPRHLRQPLSPKLVDDVGHPG